MSCFSKDITILVNTCDLYEDAWYPFFKLLKIQWPECENYDIVLNTETKTFNCDFLNVRSVRGGKDISWSRRLKRCLMQIDTECVLFFLEDYFLLSSVSNSSFEKACEIIKNNDDIGYVGLKYNRKLNYKPGHENEAKHDFVSRDSLSGGKRINCNTAIWRREWLIKLIRTHETPWEFEKYAEIRANRTGKKALQINNSLLQPVFEYEMLFEYGYGISLKKWLPKNKELFDKFDISVNFDNLGVMDWETCRKIASYSPSKRRTVKLSFHKSLKENLHEIKKTIYKQPGKIKSCFRKIKSVI